MAFPFPVAAASSSSHNFIQEEGETKQNSLRYLCEETLTIIIIMISLLLSKPFIRFSILIFILLQEVRVICFNGQVFRFPYYFPQHFNSGKTYLKLLR